MLTNRYFIALCIPFVLVGVGAIARKLIRGRGWRWNDFYLGVDLALAALTSGLVYLSELVSMKKRMDGCATEGCRVFLAAWDQRVLADAAFLVIATFGLLLVMALHQEETEGASTTARRGVLCGAAANALGTALLAGFIFYVKGVAR